MTQSSSAAIVCLLVLAPAAAQAKGQSWWLDLEGGFEYGDNVAVNQNIDENGDKIDASSGTSDVAATVEIDAGYRLVDDDTSRVEIGYNFYQSLYEELTAFNYTEHVPSLNAWTKVEGVKLGLNYSYVNAQLDAKFLLDEHILVPSASVFLTEQLYASVFYRYIDKNYNRLDNRRDAQTHVPGGDVFYYWDRPNRGYVSAGLSYTVEDTNITPADYPSYGYDGLSVRAAVQFPLRVFDCKGRLRFGYTFQGREYDDSNSTPTGVKREDQKHTARAKLEVDVDADVKIIGEYRFIDRESNLPVADYRENIGSVSLRISL